MFNLDLCVACVGVDCEKEIAPLTDHTILLDLSKEMREEIVIRTAQVSNENPNNDPPIVIKSDDPTMDATCQEVIDDIKKMADSVPRAELKKVLMSMDNTTRPGLALCRNGCAVSKHSFIALL